MPPVQFYETTVADTDGVPSYTFVSIPSRAVPERADPGLSRLSDLTEALGIFEGPSFLAQGGVVSEESVVNAVSFTLSAPPGRPEDLEGRAWIDFALEVTPWSEYLATQPLVPFESSPLSAQSVATIAGSSVTAVGASVGLVATGDPVFLLAAPAGIVVCGIATGIADAMRIGLRYRILRLMGVPDAEDHRPPPGEGGD